MDIEFRYCMTYLIAVRAGFGPAEAAILAQAAHEIDDNHIPIAVGKGSPTEYESAISQTTDILRPRRNERICPIFHFVRGDPAVPSQKRKDGNRGYWVATPNSVLAIRPFGRRPQESNSVNPASRSMPVPNERPSIYWAEAACLGQSHQLGWQVELDVTALHFRR
jgi:hypothetical protein